jgi:hypothetical protein
MEQGKPLRSKQNAVIPWLARTFYVFARARQWNLRPKCLRQLAIFKRAGRLPSRNRCSSFYVLQ